MSTLAEIEAAVPGLAAAELLRLDRILHQLHRVQGDAVVYDNRRGIVTEAGLIASADEALQTYDREEAEYDQRQAR